MTRLEKGKGVERIYYDVEEGFGSGRDLYEKESRCGHNFGFDF